MAHDEKGHAGPYFMVFIALCVCTALSAAADMIQINNKLVLIVVVMSIAVAKALFVLTYFMHLKFEGNWKLVLLAPTAILAIGLPLALTPDIGVSYYDNLAPQADYTEHSPGVAATESPESDH
jgi:cytochrome c oxidase subunit 4